MNPPTILRPDAPGRAGRRITLGLAGLAAGLLVVVGVTYLVGLSGGPTTVARITFVNPTAYTLSVDVSDGAGSGWSPAGFAPKRSTGVVEQVSDQGDVWVFRFDAQGKSGGELRLTREQLKRDGWRVDIPVEVGQRLAEAGAPPTP